MWLWAANKKAYKKNEVPIGCIIVKNNKIDFVSIVHVNNETGAINDVNEIARLVKRKNPRVIFHSDGVQAYGKIPFRLAKEVDLYSVSLARYPTTVHRSSLKPRSLLLR